MNINRMTSIQKLKLEIMKFNLRLMRNDLTPGPVSSWRSYN